MVIRILSIAFCFVLNLAFTAGLKAQMVQWADTVIAFSSEYDSKLAAAHQALGEPNKLPSSGYGYSCWSPKRSNNPQQFEYLQVGFKNPINIQQVAICENFNPGAIVKVEIFDTKHRPTTIFEEANPKKPEEKARILHILFRKTTAKIASVKVTLNTSLVQGWNQIDAIAVSTSSEPIEAKIHLSDQSQFQKEPENLGSNINSLYFETLPIISPDGKSLYFNRKDHPDNFGKQANDDIWFSTLDSAGNWSKAQRLDRPLNNEYHNFVCALSPDGNTVFLGNIYEPDGRIVGGGISKSDRVDDQWTYPEHQLIDSFENKAQYSEFHVGADNVTMVMAIENEEAHGAKDIFVSFLKDNNKWTKPLNLGPVLNSADFELAPYLAPDGKTLYFSSNGHSGYGSYDLFISKRLDDTWTNWSKPLNLGPVINSEGWDAYYSVSADGQYAYFSSTTKAIGKTDLFRIQLQKDIRPDPVYLVRGRVVDDETGQPIKAKIIYEDLDGGEDMGIAQSDSRKGVYQIVLPKGKKYGFRAEASGYYPITASLDLSKIEDFQEIKQELRMQRPQTGKTIPLNNIFFRTDSYTLLKESNPELKRLVNFLQSQPELKIMVNGHTNNQCSEKFCLSLSKNRAKAVVEYLIENGVDKKQLDFKGWGSSKPVASNESSVGRKKNQRVDFTIL